MREDEIRALLKVRALTEIEEDVNEIDDIIDIAKSQSWKFVVINDNIHPNVLDRLVKSRHIRWYKKSRNIFWKSTVLIWG